jgi:hypothetical protein
MDGKLKKSQKKLDSHVSHKAFGSSYCRICGVSHADGKHILKAAAIKVTSSVKQPRKTKLAKDTLKKSQKTKDKPHEEKKPSIPVIISGGKKSAIPSVKANPVTAAISEAKTTVPKTIAEIPVLKSEPQPTLEELARQEAERFSREFEAMLPPLDSLDIEAARTVVAQIKHTRIEAERRQQTAITLQEKTTQERVTSRLLDIELQYRETLTMATQDLTAKFGSVLDEIITRTKSLDDVEHSNPRTFHSIEVEVLQRALAEAESLPQSNIIKKSYIVLLRDELTKAQEKLHITLQRENLQVTKTQFFVHSLIYRKFSALDPVHRKVAMLQELAAIDDLYLDKITKNYYKMELERSVHELNSVMATGTSLFIQFKKRLSAQPLQRLCQLTATLSTGEHDDDDREIYRSLPELN